MKGGNNGESTSGAPKKPRLRSLCKAIQFLSPLPYLLKALQFYARSICECAGWINYSGVAVSKNGGQFGELVRTKTSPAQKMKKISTSFEPMERIDEDIPCYFPGSLRKRAAFSFPSH
ncbi:hypothetical protein SUGI_0558730 [Cryptomeria japonica]|nr:hypothetical protein SUGI_0558730 [Cryptomeria japonica]